MLFGKALFGITLGVLGASAYYKTKDMKSIGVASQVVSDAAILSLAKDVCDLKQQMTQVQTVVNQMT